MIIYKLSKQNIVLPALFVSVTFCFGLLSVMPFNGTMSIVPLISLCICLRLGYTNAGQHARWFATVRYLRNWLLWIKANLVKDKRSLT